MMTKDEEILFYAFRYAYGRKSCAVTTVKDYISDHVGELSKEFLDFVLKDFRENDIYTFGGDECDVIEWLYLRQEIKEELYKRTLNIPENAPTEKDAAKTKRLFRWQKKKK